jgi:hypothetical protein
MMMFVLQIGKLRPTGVPPCRLTVKSSRRSHGEADALCQRCAMRTMILAAMVLAVGTMASRAEAQVAYAYGAGAYPIYYGNPGYYGIPTYYGAGGYGAAVGYPAQGYYGGFTTPGFYGGTPIQNQPAPSYLGPLVQPAYGFAPTGYGYVPGGSSLYGSYSGGFTRYAQYGYRRYGSGRTFGSSVPRMYSIYQPRPGGLFDR